MSVPQSMAGQSTHSLAMSGVEPTGRWEADLEDCSLGTRRSYDVLHLMSIVWSVGWNGI